MFCTGISLRHMFLNSRSLYLQLFALHHGGSAILNPSDAKSGKWILTK